MTKKGTNGPGINWWLLLSALINSSTYRQSLEYGTAASTMKGVRPPIPQMRCHGYDAKFHHVVKLQFWGSEECTIPLHCHCSLVHSELEWLYLFGFLTVKCLQIFLSLRVFGLLSSSLLLFPQRFGRYILRPSSGVCRTQEPSRNFELRPLLKPRQSPVLIPLAITGYKC